MSATGRPEREYRSAQREGNPMSATGRPEREYRSAQREGARLGIVVQTTTFGARLAPIRVLLATQST